MPDAELCGVLTAEAHRLIEASTSGCVDGVDVAHAIGRDPGNVDLYHAFRELERRGALDLEGWRGGMGLPAFVRRPAGTSAGDDNTVIGTAPARMGSGNTIINAGDIVGNVILNQGGTAIGRGATAGPGGVAVGANANAAGYDVGRVLEELAEKLRLAGEDDTADAAAELVNELALPEPDKGIVQRAWSAIKFGATAHEFAGLLMQVEPLIRHLL